MGLFGRKTTTTPVAAPPPEQKTGCCHHVSRAVRLADALPQPTPHISLEIEGHLAVTSGPSIVRRGGPQACQGCLLLVKGAVIAA